MSQFTVLTKLWPSGTSLVLGTDTNSVTVPPTVTFDRQAAKFVSSTDGSHIYEFLFWNTGRHITNKRHVHWDFSVGGWGIWTATAWYGTPPSGPPGPARVRVDAFSIGADDPMSGSGTVIDVAASTIPAGAFPFMGDDHAIGTANGAVTVAAKDPFASLQFAGWDQLRWGGDDSGEFDESDAGASQGSASFFPVGGGTFPVNQGQSADLLALYGNSNKPNWADILGRLGNIRTNPGVITMPDPSPIDRLRLEILGTLLQLSNPGVAQGNDFQAIAEAAPRMSIEELKATLKSVQTSVALGNTAVSAIQAEIKAKAKK
jgi:hypothetical protein